MSEKAVIEVRAIGWQVVVDGVPQGASKLQKGEAITQAKELAKESRPSEVIIENARGEEVVRQQYR